MNHLIGRNIGSIVANQANNRGIDVLTTVDVDVRNATSALIGSSMLRAEALALDSAVALAR